MPHAAARLAERWHRRKRTLGLVPSRLAAQRRNLPTNGGPQAPPFYFSPAQRLGYGVAVAAGAVGETPGVGVLVGVGVLAWVGAGCVDVAEAAWVAVGDGAE